jgi:hypothetical protein
MKRGPSGLRQGYFWANWAQLSPESRWFALTFAILAAERRLSLVDQEREHAWVATGAAGVVELGSGAGAARQLGL